ncbi:dihydrodipicolinate synthase family protein [Parabacteroides goldsteinii]|uniref:dihydrodipicolinate synthase family protein n=1 Tax=Parabacteroides goldsteinii TaxID=328812 RepID=UPI0032BF9690
MEKTKIKGLIAATVTPMEKNGDINLTAIDAYAEHLIKLGVAGVFVCGTTGESLFLDTEERKKVAEAWMKFSDRLKILVHVGSTSYRISSELAVHAGLIGADAISAMGPCFLQPNRVEELVQFNKLIAEKAPGIPYYYYHIPTTSGVNIHMPAFLEKAASEIPTLNGIKYTSYNSMEMQECINYNDEMFDILHGHDETLLTGLVLGATGGIGTSYNVSAPLFNQLLQAFNKGELQKAVDIQADANKLIRIMVKYVNAILR